MKFFAIVFSIFLCLSCATEGEPEILPVSALPAKDEYNISYASHHQQKFDIHLPAGRSEATTQVFIFIHGGGWIGGDKADYYAGIPALKQAYFPKYAIVNMNYRLANLYAPGHAVPNQVDDIQSIMNHLKAKAQEYQIKPEFVLCGNSAGGHLAMLYAYQRHNPEVKAVVNIVGPADFNLPSWSSNPFNGFFGNLVNPTVIPQGMSAATYASPVTWISTSSPPTISFYGATDTTVNAAENKASLDTQLNQNGVANESYIYNGDHNAWGAEPHLSWILEKSKSFINTHNP